MKNLILLLSTLLLFGHSFTQEKQRTIFGVLTEASTGEPLIQAAVFDTVSKKGVYSNEYGFYSLTIPNKDAVLRISYGTYGSQLFSVSLDSNEFNLALRRVQEIDEVNVTATRPVESTQSGEMVLDLKTIEKLPVLLGERDVLRMLSLMPGVSSGSEGSTGIYVRGGGPDQNLILLDGVPVYNVSHLFGFFSVFNSDAISQITLYKSGFPARYGGRVSSVLDMRLKEGNSQKFNTEGSIGLISSRILVEGPLKNDRTSFAVSARRTYLDILTYPIQNMNDPDSRAGYFFYDVNAKFRHKIDDRNEIFVSGYFGRDKAFARQNSEEVNSVTQGRLQLSWGNMIGAFRWNYKIAPKLFLKSSLTYSNYLFDFQQKSHHEFQEEVYNFEQRFYSSIKDYTVKSDLEYIINPKIQLVTGIGMTNHLFTPGGSSYLFETNSGLGNDQYSFVPERLASNEVWAFGEIKQSIGKRIKVNYGLYNSAFFTADTSFFFPQPRLNLSWAVAKRGALKMGASRTAQFLHLLTNQGIGLPTDLWVPATVRIPPVEAWEGSLGYHHNLKKNWFFSAEGYYKFMNNVIQYSPGANYLSLESKIADKVEVGDGWSYGAEFFLQKKVGRWTGWIGYTLSWSWRQFENVNKGNPFPYKYDRRHDVSITSSYQINDKWDIGVVFVFWTGNALTLSTKTFNTSALGSNEYSLLGTPAYDLEEINSYRMPNYHRMDISANRTKVKKWGESVLSLGVYNVYNRQNAFFLFVETDQSGKKRLMQFSYSPIIPSISWKFKLDYTRIKENRKEKKKEQ